MSVNLSLTILILLPLCCLSLPTWTALLIHDYFSVKNINVINIFTCSQQDTVYIVKNLNKFWFRISGSNVTCDDARQGVFIDADCGTNRNFMHKEWFHSSHSWLVWSTLPWSDVVEALTDNLRYNSDVVLATPDDDNTSTVVRLRYLQHTYPGVPIHVSYTGVWNLSSRVVELPVHKIIDLQGATLNGSIVINQLSADSEGELKRMLLDDSDRKTEIMAKLNYNLWNILQDKYNFSIQLKTTKSYGYQLKNGSFDGVIGMLMRGEAELGLSSVRALSNRATYVEFVAPTWLFRSSTMFLHPKVQGVRSVLIQPFNSQLWILIGATSVFVAVLLKITSHYEVTSDHKAADAEDSWASSIITTISAICDQGSDVVHHWITWRITFFSFLVLAVLLNSYYSAAVVSFLLQPPSKTIHTVADLIKSDLKVGMTAISYNTDFFKANTVPEIDLLYQKKIHPPTQATPNQYPTEVAFRKMKDENYAIQAESITMYPQMEVTFTEQQRCALTEIDLFPSKMTFAMVKKRSQYTDIFKQGFSRLKEHGILRYETLKWRPQKPECPPLQEGLSSVDIESVSLAFIIFVGGAALSLILLLVERTLYSVKNGSNRTVRAYFQIK